MCEDSGMLSRDLGGLTTIQPCPHPIHFERAVAAREQAPPNPLKRYLAFYGYQYYPGRGMENFIGDFDQLPDAYNAVEQRLEKDRELMWGEVYDSWRRQEV